MEYTKNYHLPQWVKEDRIMMDDFNAAMAGIEAGLTACRSGTEQAGEALAAQDQALAAQIAAARQEAANADSANLAKSKSDLQKGLFRLAYNQCAHLLELEEAPALDGIFLQRLDLGKVPSNCTGMELHPDGVWCASSGPGITRESIQSSMTAVSSLKMVKNDPSACQKGVFTITSPGAVLIDRLALSGHFNDNADREKARFRLTLDDLTRNARVMDTEVESRLGGMTYGIQVSVDLYLCLQGGDTYQLELTPLYSPITGTFTHKKGDEMSLELFDTGTGSSSATVTGSFRQAETGFGGLILVRYDAHNKGGALTARWGGGEQQPLRVRTFTDRKGREVTEAEFRFTGSIPGGSKPVLKTTVPSKGDVVVYNWCAALL